MSDNREHEPGKRLKNILADENNESVLSKLPRASSGERQPAYSPPPTAIRSSPAPNPEPARSYKDLKFGPAFWNVTGILSLVVNGILLGILLVMGRYLGILHFTANDIGTGLVGGLYSNFELMDAATIRTNIPVDAQIPLDIAVPVQTTTEITLANEVVIPNAHVRINTPNINIDSDAQVTLPAGTSLSVNLNFILPVQTTIPIHLDVPVDIPLAATELHTPFVGLQEVIRPLYCLLEPEALRIDRITPVCR